MRSTQIMYFLIILLIVTAGCGSPLPPPTPIPGYVAGEEKFAYTSFIEFYEGEIEICNIRTVRENGREESIEEGYPGTAAYVGDGIWRFHIQVRVYYRGDDFATLAEEMVERRSLPDRTWEARCLVPSADSRDSAYEDFIDPEEGGEPDYWGR